MSYYQILQVVYHIGCLLSQPLTTLCTVVTYLLCRCSFHRMSSVLMWWSKLPHDRLLTQSVVHISLHRTCFTSHISHASYFISYLSSNICFTFEIYLLPCKSGRILLSTVYPCVWPFNGQTKLSDLWQKVYWNALKGSKESMYQFESREYWSKMGVAISVPWWGQTLPCIGDFVTFFVYKQNDVMWTLCECSVRFYVNLFVINRNSNMSDQSFFYHKHHSV